MENKRCIFHIPNHIDLTSKSGSSVRPQKMIQAFREIGYDVDCVMGYGSERKAAIRTIKQNIRNGVQYDFMYSESSTMPTLLTEKNHLPLYPTLDFGFMKFCKKHGIKIGLFYRDIQWKFDVYTKAVSKQKQWISLPMYRYDLNCYTKLLDKFYLPSLTLKRYLSEYQALLERADVLPPGCNEVNLSSNPSVQTDFSLPLRIFYVGGISGIYDLEMFLRAVSSIPQVEVVLCCREAEWKQESHRYQTYMTSRVKVVHASGDQLTQYYEWADICCVFAGKGEYMSIAMPIKLFEYIGYEKPMIGTAGTASGEFITEHNIGWCVNYDENDLKRCIDGILNDPTQIEAKKEKIRQIKSHHKWTSRAQKVAYDLTNI